MGNRAVIAFGTKQTAKFGIYLHWNGGRDSVEAFLDAARHLMKSRGPDRTYGPARLVQVIGNFMGGCLSVGLGSLDDLDCDNGDNGTYYVDPESLQIVGRAYHDPKNEQMKAEHRKGVLEKCIEKNAAHFFNKQAA